MYVSSSMPVCTRKFRCTSMCFRAEVEETIFEGTDMDETSKDRLMPRRRTAVVHSHLVVLLFEPNLISSFAMS